MCSLGDDNIEDLENQKYMPEIESISPFSKCNKCREATPIIVLRSKDKYCKNCFLTATVHKFKALLGKHKLIRPKDRVLVVHKGGHQSTALLHFLRAGLDLETHKKLRFEPIILFLEDHTELKLSERQDIAKKVEEEVARFKFLIYFSSFLQLLTSKCNQIFLKTKACDLELREDDQGILDDFVNKKLNTTNRKDFLDILRRDYLIEIAKFLDCKFIFTPEISSDVASQLLTDISLGRGSHVALNTGFCDFRDESVKILRPLRLFDMKELAFYNYLNNLEPVTHRLINQNPYKSVQDLMKKFVGDLQINYPATVTTILKTGDKLALNNKTATKCDLCKAPIDEENLDITSSESTQFSHWISTNTPDNSLTPQERYNKTLEAFNNLNCTNFCFACRKLQ